MDPNQSELHDILYHIPEYEHNPSFSFENQSALNDAIDEYRRQQKLDQEELDAQERDRQRAKKAVNMGTFPLKKRGKGRPERGRFTMKFFPEAN